MRIKTILNNDYQLLTDFMIEDMEFHGIYQTDLLSAAIKSADSDNILITIINNSNTIACAVIKDLKGVIITECDEVAPQIIKKANQNMIVLIKTALKAHEVTIDLFKRGLL